MNTKIVAALGSTAGAYALLSVGDKVTGDGEPLALVGMLAGAVYAYSKGYKAEAGIVLLAPVVALVGMAAVAVLGQGIVGR